ncbi:translation initiation factor IF-6 [Infirmifilum lucidum]|uniref:Translation initiation factor 6 n=1 Tax=Infirmifilum lucidum TaxID=2776706 RepID=A0A7L9FGE6_9CREN|nr:translation initiation factor IF-6 [Infirmifilum lucidum]QOJ78093.1 translation initiation factor IF-6 [Infirmifilum lucidum]
MSVDVTEIFGTPQIGVFIFINDNYALIPFDAPSKLEDKVADTLKVDVIRASIAGSRLLGVLICGNNTGVVLPRITLEAELEAVKRMGLNTAVLEDVRETSLGNLVLVNDRGCVTSPLLSHKTVKVIADTLGVECETRSLGGSPFVGSLAVATNRALAVPPFVTDEEMSEFESILKVQAGLLTVNKGRMFLRAGLVANTKGALAGSETTGHELMQIQRILFQAP